MSLSFISISLLSSPPFSLKAPGIGLSDIPASPRKRHVPKGLTPATLLNLAIGFGLHLPHLDSRIGCGQSSPSWGTFFPPWISKWLPPSIPPTHSLLLRGSALSVCCKSDQLAPPHCCHGSGLLQSPFVGYCSPCPPGGPGSPPCPAVAPSCTVVRVLFSKCKSGHVPSARDQRLSLVSCKS